MAALSAAVIIIAFFSPTLMIVRLGLKQVPFREATSAVLLLFASVSGTVWSDARIYTVSTFMYGRMPSFGDLLRWVRTEWRNG